MAYDAELADRLREILAVESTVVEKRMFGGLGFMVAGYLAVCAGSRGVLMLRVDPDDAARLIGDPRIEPFEMRGRPMKGWLGVTVDGTTPDDELAGWVDLAVDYVRTLPTR